jgi:two-component system sensor histidine kinase/response regulator
VPDFRLGPEHLSALSPYLVAFRRDLTIRALGPGWAKSDPLAAEGQPLGDVLRINRPTCPMDFDELARRVTSGAFASLVRGGLPLRGPLVQVGDDLLVFLGSIWISDSAQLSRFGLTLGDLPYADREFLFALQTKDTAIADAERIAAHLSLQRAREQQTTQAVTAQFAVTRVLADAASLEEAAPGLVQALCEVVGWSFGAVWRIDRRDPDRMRCVGTWTRAHQAPGFAEVTMASQFRFGEGLPGRVWQSGQAVWIEDVTQDANFPRAQPAARAGLRGAFALPIVMPTAAGGELVGVIEALGHEHRPPDDQVLAVMAALGSQVGQFLHRRQSEAALRQSEERLRLIIDSAIDAVVIIDAEGIVHAWNPQAERTFGWTATEAIGRSLGELIVPESLRAAHEAGMRRYRETGEGRVLGKRLEMPAVDRAGRQFSVELSISAIHRPDVRDVDSSGRSGRPVLFSGFLRDITQRLEAEAALRRAKEEAEAAAAAKTDFLAMMSHEIRTPMNAIIGLTGLLLDADLDPPQASYLRTVRDSGEALLTIINDILDFSKIEAGQLALERLVFVPEDLAGDVVDLFRPSAEAKGLVLTATVTPAVPSVVVSDPGRLRQVLNNLVGNAIKFTSAGSVTLTIDAPPGGGALDVSVRDTGVGIPDEVLPRLFRPFSQADSSMSRRYGGTGLGLAICDRLVRLMGGTVAVESVVGRGSVFRVHVPVDPAGDQDRHLTPTTRREPREPSPSAGKVRVLVVEDNPANQIVAVAMLRRLGIRADQASDGAEALAAVTRLPYDVVLMDCQMPDMDGYESARRIRALEAGHGPFRRPAIIAMTANALKGERERCLEAGMDDYLPKPVRLAELAGMLEHWVPTLQTTAAPPVAGPATSERVGSLREMLGDEWAETVQVFVSHGRETLALLTDAARRGSAGEVQALAHLLRGGAGMMGAVALEALAADLEGVAAAGAAPAAWPDRVEALTREFERVILEYH